METKQIPFAIGFSVSLSEGLSPPCLTTDLNFFLLKICWLFFQSLRCGGDEASEQASKASRQAKQASKQATSYTERMERLALVFVSPIYLPFAVLFATHHSKGEAKI
jgi:hypothetical protein